MEYPKFKVCCRCFTFNQAKYITDAMNGFTMQQTSFPFVCCIVDDASTDGEQDVIRKYVEENFDFSEGSVAYHKETDYAHITYAQHKTNKNCYFAVLDLKDNHYSQGKPKMGYLSEWRDMCEYEALCEGDDYWIDPNKLQKQVDFLDNHPDYSMVCAYHKVLFEESGYISYPPKVVEKDMMYGDFVISNNVATATNMYRLPMYRAYLREIDPITKGWYMGDVPLWLYMSANGKVRKQGFIPIVYRNHKGSASHPEDIQIWYKMKKSCEDCIDYFLEKYPLKEADVNYIKKNGIPLIKGGVLKGFLPEYQRGIRMKKRLGIPVTIKERLLYLLVCCRMSRWITKQMLDVRDILKN